MFNSLNRLCFLSLLRIIHSTPLLLILLFLSRFCSLLLLYTPSTENWRIVFISQPKIYAALNTWMVCVCVEYISRKSHLDDLTMRKILCESSLKSSGQTIAIWMRQRHTQAHVLSLFVRLLLIAINLLRYHFHSSIALPEFLASLTYVWVTGGKIRGCFCCCSFLS